MFSRRLIAVSKKFQPRRCFSGLQVAEQGGAQPAIAKAKETSTKKSSSFMQRLTAFFVGLGLGCGLNFYMVHEELRESNRALEDYKIAMNKRIAELEKSVTK